MRKKKFVENNINTRRDRLLAEKYQRNRDSLMEHTLLGLDDGTPEAALEESISFGKFDQLWEDEEVEVQRLRALHEAEEPAALRHLKRHCERIPSLKIRYNR